MGTKIGWIITGAVLLFRLILLELTLAKKED